MWFDRSTGRMWPTGRRLAITVYRIKNHPEGDGVTCQVNEIHFHFSSQGAEEGWTSVIEIYLSIIWPAGASTLIHSVKITSGWQCQLMEKENKKKNYPSGWGRVAGLRGGGQEMSERKGQSSPEKDEALNTERTNNGHERELKPAVILHKRKANVFFKTQMLI